MARGVIYYVTTDRDQEVAFGEGNYTDKLDAIGAEYLSDMTEDQSAAQIKSIEDMMYNIGAVIKRSRNFENFEFGFSFEDPEKAKRIYFKPKLDELQTAAKMITLDVMIQKATNLDSISDDDCGNLIAYDSNGLETMISTEEFIRQLEPHLTYYVYNKVIMMG